MSNEEIKAPVIDGFDECTRDEWNKPGDTTYVEFVIEGIDYCFYYKRIKPKEKSIREIIQEELKLWSHSNRDLFANAFERILENYVKKEG